MPELQIAPRSLLRQCVLEGLGVKIPAPINRRINELCDELEDAGHGDVDKHELVAALLAGVARQGDIEKLARALRRYQRTRAHEVMPRTSPDSPEVMLPVPRRGRPPRRQK
jgi:hypothetical protein